MVTEDYVSFVTAKLLMEKGFEGDCEYMQDPNNNPYSNSGALVSYPKPTLQMALKWLREVHNIIVVIEPRTYSYEEEKMVEFTMGIWCGDNYEEYYEGGKHGSYEEACNEAIKYCLEKLI